MKKILAVLALMVSVSAFAGNSGVTTEFEVEQGQGKDKGTNGNSVSVSPYIKFGDGWKADVKFDAGRDHGAGQEIDAVIEPRIRKDFKVTDNLTAGLRVGIGEKFKSTGDFGYYTVEPMTSYKLTQPWSINASLRFRNAFNTANEYSTRTLKLGTAYKVTNEDEVGLKFFEKYGDSRSRGLEFVYTKGF